MIRESFTHPCTFGYLVRSERKRLKMNQTDFYHFLFPDNKKEEETIKKKMNNIENGKQKSVDFDMLLAICKKCDVSADYILGLKTDYRNHANEFVCSYTGLDEKAVACLHKWNMDKHNGADLSLIGKAFGGDQEQAVNNAYKKQSAITFLRIINCLFKEGELPSDNNRKDSVFYSNLRILHSLYLMCMAKPKTISGTPVFDESDILQDLLATDLFDPYLKQMISNSFQYSRIDGSKPVFMKDDNDVTYLVSMKDVLEQIARRQLDRALDDLIVSVNTDDSGSY